MAICPKCEGVFPPGIELCQFDRTRLVDGPMCPSCQLEHTPGRTQCKVCGAPLRPPQSRQQAQPVADAVAAPSLGRPPLTPSARPGANPSSLSPAGAPATVASATTSAPTLPAPVPSGGAAGAALSGAAPRSPPLMPPAPGARGARPPGLGTGLLEMPPQPGASPPGASPVGVPPPPVPPRPPGMGGAVPPPELAAIPGMSLRSAVPLPTTAGFGSRAIAFLIDQAIVQGIPFALMTVGVFGAAAASGGEEPSDALALGLTGAFYLVWGFLALGNFVVLQGLRGQTIGKMALGLKVLKEDGEPIGIGWALLRYICYATISQFLCGLGFWWALWDDKGQTWHDKVCRTVVTFK